MRKFLVALAAILGFAIASRCKSSYHGLWGTLGSEDTRILRQDVNVSSSILKVVTRYVDFPSAGNYNDRIITCIRAYNYVCDGKGASVRIRAGGIGRTLARIHFQSQKGRGIYFSLSVWVK